MGTLQLAREKLPETGASGRNAFAHGLTLALMLGAMASSYAQDSTPPRVAGAADLVLADPTGKKTRPLAEEGQRGTLVFFLMHDCPIANSYAPEINRIARAYADHKIRSYVIYVESDLTPKAAREHVKDYGFTCGALLDPDHLLVRAVGASVSPEAALLSPTGEIVYRGRIDDRAAGFGKRRVEPTQRDLRLALDAFLAGQRIASRFTKAVGCYIPDTTAKPGSKSTSP